MRGAVCPTEDDAPLLVVANAVISAPAPPKSLEPIARRRPEVQESVRSAEHVELSDRDRHDVAREGSGPPGARTVVEIGGRLVAERRDHSEKLPDTRYPCNRPPGCPTDRASAAPASADRLRRSRVVECQKATRPQNAQLAGVSCKPLLGGVRFEALDERTDAPDAPRRNLLRLVEGNQGVNGRSHWVVPGPRVIVEHDYDRGAASTHTARLRELVAAIVWDYRERHVERR